MCFHESLAGRRILGACQSEEQEPEGDHGCFSVLGVHYRKLIPIGRVGW